MIPIYGFLEGDTMGLLLLATPDETVGAVAERLQTSAAVRVAPKARVVMLYAGRRLDPSITIGHAGIAPLDRIDVVTDREEAP